MGMTIDEAIEIINHYLDYPQEEVRKALLLAINIMRKYQKIEQIINYRYRFCVSETLDEIIKVINE